MRDRRRHIDWGETIIPAMALSFVLAFFLQTADGPLDALLWPLFTAGVVLIFLFFIVKQFVLARRAEKSIPAAPEGPPLSLAERSTRRVGLILSASVGYLLLIPHLGFTLTNFAFMLVVFRSLGSRRWGQNLAVAAGVALFLHVALVLLMKQELPRLTIGGLTI